MPCKTEVCRASRSSSTRVAAGATCELKVYPYGHYDIYRGAPFEVVIRDRLAFLARMLPVGVAETPRAAASVN